MRVIVEASVFRRERVSEYHHDLLALFVDDPLRARHTIEIEPSAKGDFSRWIGGEGEMTRARCYLVLEKSRKLRARYDRARTLRIADVATPSWTDLRLPPSRAVSFLRRPLRLLVENARNELNFLRVLTRLAVDFNLDELINERVVEIDTNGGIDENRKWLESNTHMQELTRRMWVMCDSDARQPWVDASGRCIQERLGPGAMRLHELCKKHNIPIHILRRRAIDNYVPLELLAAWSYLHQDKRERRYRAFARLTDEQRYHYNMKNGFLKDEKDKEYTKKVGSLYDGLDPEVRRELEEGFDDGRSGVAELFDETKYHDGMAQIRVHERWLREDKQEDEARRIVESIKELL